MARVGIIGGYGAVGRTTALLLAQRRVADEIVLTGPHQEKGQAVARDLADAFAIGGMTTVVSCATDPKAIEGADVVIVTAGRYRTPDEPRSALIPTNAGILSAAADNVRRYASEALVIVVTNPLDAMVEQAFRSRGGDPIKSSVWRAFSTAAASGLSSPPPLAWPPPKWRL